MKTSSLKRWKLEEILRKSLLTISLTLLVLLLINFAKAGDEPDEIIDRMDDLTEKQLSTDYDTKLNKSQKAPFDGVLVPVDMYRYYRQETSIENQITKDTDEAMISADKLKSRDPLSYILTGVLGGLAGYCLAKPCFSK